MLRIVKVKKTKRGFTLLETLLSVALLVIISAMMMNGFMATINYSHNTSVYAKSAATNYSNAMSKLAYYAAEGSKDGAPRTAAYVALASDGADRSLKFSGGVPTQSLLLSGSTGKIKLKMFAEKQNSSGLNDNVGLSQYSEDYTGGAANDSTYLDNRYSFTYIPYENADGDGDHMGELRIFRKNTADPVEYWWGYYDDDGDVVEVQKIC